MKPESIALGTTALTDDRHFFESEDGSRPASGPLLSSSAPQMSVSLAGATPSQIAKLRGVVMELAADDGSVTLADGRQLPKNVFRQVRFCPAPLFLLALVEPLHQVKIGGGRWAWGRRHPAARSDTAAPEDRSPGGIR